MIPVTQITLTPKKNPVFVEVTPPKRVVSFVEANRYIRDLQMLTFKGQHTTLTYSIEWCGQGYSFAWSGEININFYSAQVGLNLIDMVIRSLVSSVEYKQDRLAAMILKTCFVGDNYRETA